ncbi:hypothetical protein [Streptomyces sp. NBC_01237]|uniref:hypothetical protein n=1 Tax=Streptomyces sp. NBC_01237 TaxID=2903790 RepID=UPI002DDB6D93|nr:hypothetical protein [Streptomyces sp. NBC_01237]WRZ77236.1 hypothetical protein OG251_36890 [Streptomyces sp. NBC_01237]
MAGLQDGRVWASHHLFYLTSGPPMPDRVWLPSPATAGLVTAREGAIMVETGIHTGDVRLAIEVLDREPPLSAGWEDVAEVSVVVPNGILRVQELMEPSVFPDLPLQGPGSYRIRVHANGREFGHRGVEFAERYLMSLWMAPLADDAVVHLTAHSRCQARARAMASNATALARAPRPPRSPR